MTWPYCGRSIPTPIRVRRQLVIIQMKPTIETNDVCLNFRGIERRNPMTIIIIPKIVEQTVLFEKKVKALIPAEI